MERKVRFGYCCAPEETALYAEAGFDFFECNASAVLCQDDYKERLAQAHEVMKKWGNAPYKTDGTLEERGNYNFLLTNRIDGAKKIIAKAERQKKGGKHSTEARLVRIGDVAFASNGFELFMDYMHRIQARSPFIQTFVVELAGHLGKDQQGGYLATQRAVDNKGYSATINQCPVSPKGGQELVEATVKGLKELAK